ncbi:MAG: hypothetical protein LBQ00_04445 [Syntrophobacterales bacterium]|jgi:5'(3')-deoxyribonucleotidase|nr:hypothetical protein [Syntrophobacterales bacterium]
MKRKTVYMDMDNVRVDFPSGIAKLDADTKAKYEGCLDEVPGIFSLMEPMPGAIEAVDQIAKHYDVFILSTAPWLNPSAWSDKLPWVHKYFGAEKGSSFYKRLILTHHKDLLRGDFLIDDRTKNGASEFRGELIQFGSEKFPYWPAVIKYLVG